ncbi:MAG: HDOD domain-containing protein [Desulfobacterota bacterium]|nr:HDOD domain-containing protein [Thermodesulfobacteriota bacterium]
MTRETKIDKIVQTIEQIPTLPVISTQILNLFRNENITIRQIQDLIERDPPLAAKILKIVNSSFYGLLNKVSTIEHAIIILGTNEVRSVALGFALQNHFKTHSNHFEPARFWKHSIICSQIAKYLAKYFNVFDDGTYFLAGLIHDLGKLVIDQYFPEEFKAIVAHITENRCSFSKAEKEVLGVTHYQIGAKLLRQWNFPEKVIMQIFYHHAPWHDKNFTTESTILYLANVLTKISGFTCSSEEPPVSGKDIVKPSLFEFMNKTGLDIDQESYKNLLLLIRELIAAETNNVLTIFE